MLNFLILSLIFVGLSSIVIGYAKIASKCQPTKIEYRYIPRTFKEEQEDPILPSDIFYDMFTKPTTFAAGFSIGKLGPIRNENEMK